MSALQFDPVSHTYRKDGLKLPHITGVLKLVQPTDFFTEEGRERGDDAKPGDGLVGIGKNKDKKWSDVETGYLKWISNPANKPDMLPAY